MRTREEIRVCVGVAGERVVGVGVGVARWPSHSFTRPLNSHSTPTDLALARPPLPLKLSAPFSYASLRLILPLIATPSHRSSHLTFSAPPRDRIDTEYSA